MDNNPFQAPFYYNHPLYSNAVPVTYTQPPPQNSSSMVGNATAGSVITGLPPPSSGYQAQLLSSLHHHRHQADNNSSMMAAFAAVGGNGFLPPRNMINTHEIAYNSHQQSLQNGETGSAQRGPTTALSSSSRGMELPLVKMQHGMFAASSRQPLLGRSDLITHRQVSHSNAYSISAALETNDLSNTNSQHVIRTHDLMASRSLFPPKDNMERDRVVAPVISTVVSSSETAKAISPAYDIISSVDPSTRVDQQSNHSHLNETGMKLQLKSPMIELQQAASFKSSPILRKKKEDTDGPKTQDIQQQSPVSVEPMACDRADKKDYLSKPEDSSTICITGRKEDEEDACWQPKFSIKDSSATIYHARSTSFEKTNDSLVVNEKVYSLGHSLEEKENKRKREISRRNDIANLQFLLRDCHQVEIPLNVTADLAFAVQRSRTNRIRSICKRFPSLLKVKEGNAEDQTNSGNNDAEEEQSESGQPPTKGSSEESTKASKKQKFLPKLKNVPKPSDYASVLDYLEAKYVQGIMVNDDDEIMTTNRTKDDENEDSVDGGENDDEGGGSVYSESSFLDDSGLQRTIAEQVLGQATTTKLELLENDNDFFVNVGRLEVEESELTTSSYDPLSESKTGESNRHRRPSSGSAIKRASSASGASDQIKQNKEKSVSVESNKQKPTDSSTTTNSVDEEHSKKQASAESEAIRDKERLLKKKKKKMMRLASKESSSDSKVSSSKDVKDVLSKDVNQASLKDATKASSKDAKEVLSKDTKEATSKDIKVVSSKTTKEESLSKVTKDESSKDTKQEVKQALLDSNEVSSKEAKESSLKNVKESSLKVSKEIPLKTNKDSLLRSSKEIKEVSQSKVVDNSSNKKKFSSLEQQDLTDEPKKKRPKLDEHEDEIISKKSFTDQNKVSKSNPTDGNSTKSKNPLKKSLSEASQLLQKKVRIKRRKLDTALKMIEEYVRDSSHEELPRKPKQTIVKKLRVELKCPKDKKTGDMITFTNPHVKGQKLRVKIPANRSATGTFKVTVPVSSEVQVENSTQNGEEFVDYNRISRKFYDLLEHYARTFDEWCDAEGEYRKSIGDENSFTTHFEKRKKFEPLLGFFPNDELKTPVDKAYLQKILRRARQNKNKREKAMAMAKLASTINKQQDESGSKFNNDLRTSREIGTSDIQKDVTDEDDYNHNRKLINDSSKKLQLKQVALAANKNKSTCTTIVVPQLSKVFPRKKLDRAMILS